jgi:photosystem II stability/assembly factor-like uncharacterized protein
MREMAGEHTQSYEIKAGATQYILFYISILIFILSFSFSDTPPPGNWTLQYLPASIGNRQISDMVFVDSVNGYAVTAYISLNNTAYILKTTNAGYNWYVSLTTIGAVGFTSVKFLNNNTGYVAGTDNMGANPCIRKTTNAGLNWLFINTPLISADDIFVVNEDTIFIADENDIDGGLFRTTNGGQTWSRIYYAPPINPERIYFINKNNGFYNKGAQMYRTSDGGFSWSYMGNNIAFVDIQFLDSTTGYWSRGVIRKTTNAGVNWETYLFPQNDPNLIDGVGMFTYIGSNKIRASGPEYWFPNTIRGVLLKSTNEGQNWTYQIPDTGYIKIVKYRHGQYLNDNTGWEYGITQAGIHTTNGGDTTWNIVSIGNNENNKLPDNFILYQNYPNPFNPETNIKYILKEKGHVRIIIYNIEGKEVTELLNKEQVMGEYNIRFNPENILPSGVYFYKLLFTNKDNIYSDTRKMIFIK